MKAKQAMIVRDGNQEKLTFTATTQLVADRWASWLFTWLLQHQHWRTNQGFRARSWRKVYQWALVRFHNADVAINIHGRRAFANFGHSYPLFARTFRNWNNPLIEIIAQAHKKLGRAVSVLDVGAGIGDTVLLVEANCAEAVSGYLCVEGDPHFATYLSANTLPLAKVRIANTMLAAEATSVASLVRTHPGTASATGSGQREAVTLDQLLERLGSPHFDVLKIDVDGFDGRVLAGSHNLLDSDKPAVIFEWHPNACTDTGNQWTEHFEVLAGHGYDRFIWFNKFGDFSHFSAPPHTGAVALVELAARRIYDIDWHYDVVALHRESQISHIEIAELPFARARRSWY